MKKKEKNGFKDMSSFASEDDYRKSKKSSVKSYGSNHTFAKIMLVLLAMCCMVAGAWLVYEYFLIGTNSTGDIFGDFGLALDNLKTSLNI